MDNFFKKFKIDTEKEELSTVIKNIENGVVFRGTNLWILIFAIFVASLGLNINSTAVIIGAMLISPLMGPIMGIGLGIGIYDLALLRKSFYNYLVATGVALATSTVFFLLSPINDAHSEILARTAPTIYDVLIALFGGLAGIIAVSSKQKGNVIPGVAIATALMPPICTAGYGLATLQLSYFFGAFYLFIINTVFIALASFIIVRLLHFPYKKLGNSKAERVAQRIIWMVVVVTLLPSLYLGYDLVQQNRFIKNVNSFIANEALFPNDYLLNKKIDAKAKSIVLVFGGIEISKAEIDRLKSQLKKYSLENASLEVNQGFAYLSDNKKTEQNDQLNQLANAFVDKEKKYQTLQSQIDSVINEQKINNQIFKELKVQYPIDSAIIGSSIILKDSSKNAESFLVLLYVSKRLSTSEKSKIENWLKVRLGKDNIRLKFQ